MYHPNSSLFDDQILSDGPELGNLQIQKNETLENPTQPKQPISSDSFSILESHNSEAPKQDLQMISRDEISSDQELDEFLVEPKHSRYQTMQQQDTEIQ